MLKQHQTAGFDLPHLLPDDKIRRVLSSSVKNRLGNVIDIPPQPPIYLQYWDEKYFNLNQVSIFNDASLEEKQKILHLCNLSLLEEAYFIEKAGVGYMSKMVSLAESFEERMLYALFSGDEVTHLTQISKFLPTPEIVGTNNSFLRFLADLIETDDKAVLLFILQVVLEGWGLTHYRNLANTCQDSELATIFKSFLQEESRHHAAGTTFFSDYFVSSSSEATIIEALQLFLTMVRVGPQGVVAAIEFVKGHLSPQQKVQIFAQLDTQTHSGSRLVLLRSLIDNPNSATILEELDTRGLFQPLNPQQCLIC
jgi:tRNA isopentenyl-2-thiomethyl-A-37 hydroxylase MiaE